MTSTPDLRRICCCDRRSGIGPHWHSLQEGCTREPTCQHGEPADDCKTCATSCESIPNSMISAVGDAIAAQMIDDEFDDEPEHDPVNHPSHYTQHPSGVECIQITEHMGFCLGNATKYLFRAEYKGRTLEDIRKAAWYVSREIERRTSETWATFPDDPRYEVSSAGRVRWAGSERIRSLVKIKGGYLTFSTNRDGRAVTYYVHRAVARTFFGDIPAGMHVCHTDGDRENNHVSNLRIDTVRGNARDRRVHGRSSRNGQAKLDAASVQDIRSRVGESESALAAEFGVTRTTIGRVRRGESWTDRRLEQEIDFESWVEHEPPSHVRDAIELIWRAQHQPLAVDSLRMAAWCIERAAEERSA